MDFVRSLVAPFGLMYSEDQMELIKSMNQIDYFLDSMISINEKLQEAFKSVKNKDNYQEVIITPLYIEYQKKARTSEKNCINFLFEKILFRMLAPSTSETIDIMSYVAQYKIEHYEKLLKNGSVSESKKEEITKIIKKLNLYLTNKTEKVDKIIGDILSEDLIETLNDLPNIDPELSDLSRRYRELMSEGKLISTGEKSSDGKSRRRKSKRRSKSRSKRRSKSRSKKTSKRRLKKRIAI